MENIKNINLKDIKENLYYIEKIKIQYKINNIWFNLYDKNNKYFNMIDDKYIIESFDKIKNKLLSKYSYNKFFDETTTSSINFNIVKRMKNKEFIDIIEIKTYKNEFINSINTILLYIISNYIFNNKKDKENEFLDILNNNLEFIDFVICNYNKNIKGLYFNKKLFEDINKLNLDLQFYFKYLNTKDKIINVDFKTFWNNKISKKFLLDNNINLVDINNKLYNYNDNYDYNMYLRNSKNSYNLLYEEILIINCNNFYNNNDDDDNDDKIIIEETNDINLNIYDKKDLIKQITELKEELKNIKIENEKLKLENKNLEELKNKKFNSSKDWLNKCIMYEPGTLYDY